MNIIVNGLSSTNLSSHHVLLGHLRQLAQWTREKHTFTVLYHQGNKNLCLDLGENVKWVEAPAYVSHWAMRTMWEKTRLPGLVKSLKGDLVWLPTGAIVPGLDIPQVSYAMNPWALVAEVPKNGKDKLKAWAQRAGYRQAMKSAAMMLFLSEYMRRIFRENAGGRENASEIVYTGLDEALFVKARSHQKQAKKSFQVLSVSAMAAHKGCETLLQAMSLVRKQYDIPATLVLAGPWPDPVYERRMRRLIAELGLQEVVHIKGHVSVAELHDYYAESKVFSLMSTCESFGIPAVEAQAFGTPVVSSNCCAIPEVCGQGGIYPEPKDIEGTAEALALLLSDHSCRERYSLAAQANAERYHWEICSRPLLRMFDVVGG